MIHLNFRPFIHTVKGAPSLEGRPLTHDLALQTFQQLGYALEHGTRPATAGLAIGSNPVSLLAWWVAISLSIRYSAAEVTLIRRIGEKFLDWSDNAPSIETILTFATLYWVTDTYPSSIYEYRYVSERSDRNLRQHFGAKAAPRPGADFLEKPFGYSYFKHELYPTPVSEVAKSGNMVWSREHDIVGCRRESQGDF